MRLNIPQVDLEKASGRWLTYVPGVRVKLCRFHSKHANAVKQRLLKEMRDGLTSNEEVDPEKTTEYILRVYAEGVVLDWEGLIDLDKNTPLKYTPEVAYQILSNDENVEFFNWIALQAEKFENFAKEVREDNIKKQESS